MRNCVGVKREIRQTYNNVYYTLFITMTSNWHSKPERRELRVYPVTTSFNNIKRAINYRVKCFNGKGSVQIGSIQMSNLLKPNKHERETDELTHRQEARLKAQTISFNNPKYV